MKVQTYQKRNLLWIAALVTAYTMTASALSKTRESGSLNTSPTQQVSNR